jgi:hypothetical protein
MQNSSSYAPSLNRSNSNASSKYSFDENDEKAGGGSIFRGQTNDKYGAGDGLREDGRGYRGF